MQKTVVITGATSGIGFAAVKGFVQSGCSVIGIGRTSESCRKAVKVITEEFGDSLIHYIQANLAFQKQVRRAAAEILSLVDEKYSGKIDVLINNAGTFPSWYQASEDGYELQFAVNYLSHFLLTNLLLSKIQGRILSVSSGSHYHTKMHWNDLMYRKHYHPLAAYKQSKLAVILFTNELNRRFSGHYPLRAYAVDPGLVHTAIGEKRTGGFIKWFWSVRKKYGITPEKAAKTLLYLGTEESLPHEEEVYWKESTPKEPSKESQSSEDAARLWNISQRLCGLENSKGETK